MSSPDTNIPEERATPEAENLDERIDALLAELDSASSELNQSGAKAHGMGDRNSLISALDDALAAASLSGESFEEEPDPPVGLNGGVGGSGAVDAGGDVSVGSAVHASPADTSILDALDEADAPTDAGGTRDIGGLDDAIAQAMNDAEAALDGSGEAGRAGAAAHDATAETSASAVESAGEGAELLGIESVELLDEALAGASQDAADDRAIDAPAARGGVADDAADTDAADTNSLTDTGDGFASADDVVAAVAESMGMEVEPARRGNDAPDVSQIAPDSESESAESDERSDAASGSREEAESAPSAGTPARVKRERSVPAGRLVRAGAIGALRIISAPMAMLSPELRSYVGWFAAITLFNALAVWIALLVL